MNLTAITEKRRSIFKTLFLIPLQLLFYYDFSKPFSICDVGAGAGFPSIPLKNLFPALKSNNCRFIAKNVLIS